MVSKKVSVNVRENEDENERRIVAAIRLREAILLSQ